MKHKDIFSFIKTQESEYETEEIKVGDNWDWNMRNHVQMIFHLKHGRFYTGDNDYLRAFKQVMLPLLRLSYWTEDIDLKDVVFFIEQSNGRVLSFLVKKYHDEVFAKENDVDALIDQITVSDIDYGGVLVQDTNDMPEVIPLTKIAFADQTDLLGGAIGLKFNFSPDSLRKMKAKGWGEEANGATISIEDLITLAEFQKEPAGDKGKKNTVPSKTIEVYIVRGSLPEHFIEDNNNMEDWYNQVHVAAFYKNEQGKRVGVHLYRQEANEDDLLFHTSEPVDGRALGFSDGESFIQPQIWSNFLEITKTKMLEAGSKVIPYTDDPAFVNRNQINEMENLEMLTIEPGSSVGIVPTIEPAKLNLVAQAADGWLEHAQLLGFAQDPILGKEPVSGTTFRGQERTVAQGRGWHDRRRGQRAKFIEAIYRKIIIPRIAKKIVGGKKFLASLSNEELSWVADQLATNYANSKIKERLLKGEIPTPEEQKILTDTFKTEFSKGGNQKMIEILKDEFKGVEIKMGINVANKQKDLVNLSDKLLSIFQFVFANPQGFQQAMQIPALAKSFQDILEFSGLNQSDFLSLVQPPEQPTQELQQPQQPQQPLQVNQPVNAGNTQNQAG